MNESVVNGDLNSPATAQCPGYTAEVNNPDLQILPKCYGQDTDTPSRRLLHAITRMPQVILGQDAQADRQPPKNILSDVIKDCVSLVNRLWGFFLVWLNKFVKLTWHETTIVQLFTVKTLIDIQTLQMLNGDSFIDFRHSDINSHRGYCSGVSFSEATLWLRSKMAMNKPAYCFKPSFFALLIQNWFDHMPQVIA